jgi:UDP-N-acetylmuramate--alanine ligase
VVVPQVDELPERLADVVADGDVVLTLGAGNIGAVAAGLRDSHAVADDGPARSAR